VRPMLYQRTEAVALPGVPGRDDDAGSTKLSETGGRIVDMTLCPQCGEPAEVQWRDVLESTDGPIEHAKILCVNRHWFLLPVADLTCPPPVIRREAATRRKSDETAASEPPRRMTV
jgi:hypothetical protein